MESTLLPKDIVTLAQRVVAENTARGVRIAVAESCTGGLVTAALTEIPGSSAVLDRGFVTYSNAAKHELLGVPNDLIETFGAVSIAVAWSMAQGALKRSAADIAVAITGVAGPDGGSAQKPVGTVVFARAGRDTQAKAVNAEQRNYPPTGSRSDIRLQATICALELLLP